MQFPGWLKTIVGLRKKKTKIENKKVGWHYYANKNIIVGLVNPTYKLSCPKDKREIALEEYRKAGTLSNELLTQLEQIVKAA